MFLTRWNTLQVHFNAEKTRYSLGLSQLSNAFFCKQPLTSLPELDAAFRVVEFAPIDEAGIQSAEQHFGCADIGG